MYSKTYWITCEPGNSEGMLAHYDAEIAPAITASERHVGHHMIQVGSEKWLLVSNYVSQTAAEESVAMVQELIKPMIGSFGMTLEPIAEGEVIRVVG